MAKKKAKINREERQQAIMDLADDLTKSFYEAIAEAWEDWIEYKYQQHSEQYATPGSEMNAIRLLMRQCEGSVYIAQRVIEYAQARLWHGLYLPGQADRGILLQWKEEEGTREITRRYPHLNDLVAKKFPQSAWLPENSEWFRTASAEAQGDYELYVAETKTFFGSGAAILDRQSFFHFFHQFGEFSAGLTPGSDDAYEVASARLQWHIDFNSLPSGSITEYFKTRCKNQMTF